MVMESEVERSFTGPFSQVNNQLTMSLKKINFAN